MSGAAEGTGMGSAELLGVGRELVELGSGVEVVWIDGLPGVEAGRQFGYVGKGVVLPPGGLAYVVERQGEDAARVIGYLDRYSRAFDAHATISIPPACRPALQFFHLAGGAGSDGCVSLTTDDATVRVAEFSVADDRVTFTDSRVELGARGRALCVVDAVCLAYLAFSFLPRERGIELAAVGVDEILGKLRGDDLFDAVDDVVATIEEAASRPLFSPPGILLYLAQALRETGIVGKTAADLAAKGQPTFEIPGLTVLSADGQAAASLGQLIMASLGQHLGSAVPKIRLLRTNEYARLFYVAFDPNRLSPEGVRMLVETESVLNRFLLMAQRLEAAGALTSATLGQCAELDQWVLEDIVAQGLGSGDEPLATVAHPADDDILTDSELDVRLAFSRACEGLVVPYRLEYRFRYDAAQGALLVDVGCPEPAVMPRRAWDRAQGEMRELTGAEREGIATRYAFHLVLLVAARAFACDGRVGQVTVSAWRDVVGQEGQPEGDMEWRCVLSARFEREGFLSMLAEQCRVTGTPPLTQQASGAAQAPVRLPVEADPLVPIRDVPHAFGLGGDASLQSVRPLASIEAPQAMPDGVFESVETDERPFDEAGASLLRARRVCDMAIYEDSPRKPLAHEVLQAFANDDVSAVLATLRDMHDRTENIPVRQTCLQVSEAVAAGSITASSADELLEMFSDVYGLKSGLREATKLVQRDRPGAVARLEALLAGVEECGWFVDSPTRAYRYFDCYASRALYAMRCGDDIAGRELRLCADEYFLAHHRLATLLADSLDRNEDAIAHARRCVEIAPSVGASYLRLARCYFCSFDYVSEIDVLKRMMRIAWNPSDIGMALYWLGYAFWMTGDADTGLACYQRCTRYDRDLADPVSAEVTEFLRKEGVSSRALGEDEVDELLTRAGVPASQLRSNALDLMRGAGAAARAGSYRLAQNLTGSAAVILRDDALAPVLESLGASGGE